MSTPLSSITSAALGRQLNKGTAASTGYIRARASKSSMNERPDIAEAINEHSGVHKRPTIRQGTPARSGYLVETALDFNLYPALIGEALIGAGFKCTTTAQATVTTAAAVQTITFTAASAGTFKVTFDGQTTAAVAYNVSLANLQTALEALSNLVPTDVVVTGTPGSSYVLTFGNAWLNKTPPTVVVNSDEMTVTTVAVVYTTKAAGAYYVHTFTPAERCHTGWLSMLHALGDCGDRWERRTVDMRLSALNLDATPAGIVCTTTGLGLTIGVAAGSETVTAETNARINSGSGSFSILKDALQLVGAPRGHALSIANALAKDEQGLHTFYRADLSQVGLDITGTLRNLDMTYAIYRHLRWGSLTGTIPTAVEIEAALDWNWVSPGNMGTGDQAFPYKLQVAIPVAVVRMGNFEAAGADLIRFDATYQMQDRATTAPCTISLTNLTADYVGS